MYIPCADSSPQNHGTKSFAFYILPATPLDPKILLVFSRQPHDSKRSRGEGIPLFTKCVLACCELHGYNAHHPEKRTVTWLVRSSCQCRNWWTIAAFSIRFVCHSA